MNHYRKLPAFSKFLAIMLVARFLKSIGKARTFFKLMSKTAFSDKEKSKAFKTYQGTEKDVFAAVYSKSGTNWLMQTAQQIICKGEAEFEYIHEVVPWPESPFSNFAPLKGQKLPQNAHDQMRVIKSSGKARVIPVYEHSKYINVIRDPKEVVVSGYHFIQGIFGLHGVLSAEEWVDLFCSPDYPVGPWAPHTASWWKEREQPNVLIIPFAEMKKDVEGVTKKVADFMGIDLTEEEMKKVLHKSSFGYMKQHEDLFGPPQMPLVDADKVPDMIRKGKSGGSGELLSKEQQARIDQYCLRELERLGSEFPYREWFMQG